MTSKLLRPLLLLSVGAVLAGSALVVLIEPGATANHRPADAMSAMAGQSSRSTGTTSDSVGTSASSSTASLTPTSRVVFAHHVAQWNVMCTDDHYSMDDPIVFPGMPGMAHMHTFYGNTSTDAYSTPASLSASSPSSCGRGMGTSDLSAYWVPSLMKKNADGSSSVIQSQQVTTVYYRRAGGGMGPRVNPFPLGLRMIAGDAKATSDQSLKIVQWDCGGGGVESPHMYQCPGTAAAPIHASLVFPSCWDGVHLDSADHKSHMAYAASDGTCPKDHPVSLPEVTFEVDFPGIGGGPNYYLASGGIYSFHGDFIADWDNQVQNALVGACLNTPHECGDMNRDGHVLFRPSYDPEPIRIDMREFSNASPYYWGCRSLNQAFRHGVAKNRTAAARQVRQGNGRPDHGPRARDVYWANHTRLDRDRDGTVCER